ncbi:hypothetical protein N0V90_005022 [Kalmusia sp. IMI 367209]|nr:hypothetical protein N0V90_005022 [Kalmusia sp. IMI 367209]
MVGPDTSFSCQWKARVSQQLNHKGQFLDLEYEHVYHAAEVHNYTPAASIIIEPVSFCNISITLTHSDDIVRAWFWFPLDDWNGRFLVAGGGGLSAGSEAGLIAPLSQGFATGSTDAGLTLNGTINDQSGAWAIRSPGVLNEDLIKNFAYRSIHDVVTVGKAVTQAFYGKKPKNSYYSGCSTGGRQGYIAAQRYPRDFDGIMANAPAIYTPRVSPGVFWPSVVMSNIEAPPNCVFEAYQAAIISACDALDGLADQIISKSETCKFDTEALIGSTISCADTGGSVTITAIDADVVAKILRGPRDSRGEWLWYGVPLGASFSGLASTATSGNVTVPVPFASGEAWIRYFVFKDPVYDTANMSFTDFFKAYKLSVETYTEAFGTDNPDLSQFRKAGGKLLTWHGLSDAYIAHKGSIRYRHSLERQNGGAEATNEFHRLFLAPGVAHCGGGNGPVPTDPLSDLLNWVEKGIAPDSLPASTNQNGTVISRNLCPYPYEQTYIKGKNPNIPGSFYCA